MTSSDRLLIALKREFTKLPALPPVCQPSPNAQDQRVLARDVLELAVLSAVRRGDGTAFDRNFAQLRPYYLDLRSNLQPSQQEPLLTGLHLLHLLVQNRIAEFHTAVELISADTLKAPEVSQVAQLEAWLMEGAYNKVLSALTSAASPYYIPLMERLALTVRDEIASCSEAAYDTLPAADAARILRLGSETELVEYAQGRGWKVADGTVTFFGARGTAQANGNAQNGAGDEPKAQFETIEHCMAYAKELGRIV